MNQLDLPSMGVSASLRDVRARAQLIARNHHGAAKGTSSRGVLVAASRQFDVQQLSGNAAGRQADRAGALLSLREADAALGVGDHQSQPGAVGEARANRVSTEEDDDED